MYSLSSKGKKTNFQVNTYLFYYIRNIQQPQEPLLNCGHSPIRDGMNKKTNKNTSVFSEANSFSITRDIDFGYLFW